MRLLFLTSELPHPAESGATIKTASILAYLRRSHEVQIVCFRRGAPTLEQTRWAAEARWLFVVDLDRRRSAFNLLRSYLAGVPLSIQRNRSRHLAGFVARRLAEASFDAIFVDGWLMAQYLPKRFAGPAFLHEHNAEYVMWRRQAQRERNPLLRALIRLEYGRVRRYEASILPRFHTVFAVSEADRQALLGLGAAPQRLRILPNLPDPALLERPPLALAETEPLLLYFGTLSWPPNIDGLEFFLGSVFPLVRRRLPEARFAIAGKGAPARLQRLAERTAGVEFLGPVADPEPLYRRARLFVEASRTGGGTRLKVLNALARGLPVVASGEGAEGLEVVPGQHLLVAGDSESMAEAVVRLLSEGALWQNLSENGRALVRSRYVAEAAYGALDEALSGVGASA